MNKKQTVRAVSLSVLAASLAMAFGSAHAADDDLARLIRPESSARLGLGYLTEDAARFGQYSGMPELGTYAIADINLVRREDTTGRWLLLNGHNLGLDNRNLRFEHGVQGSWRYFLEYDQTPRFSQYEVNTDLAGIGHGTQEIDGAAAMRDKRLHTQREAISVGGQYVLAKGWDVRLKLKQDTKSGNRLFGAYPAGPLANNRVSAQTVFLAEPVDHVMKQIDLVLGYSGQKLQMSAGYYGSFFENAHRALTLANDGGTKLTNGWTMRGTGADLFTEVGLPPDNFAHQFYVDGGYSFTPTTRANFKLARTIAHQQDRFIDGAAAGRSNLGGKLETTLAQVGLSARPLQKLTVVADWRHENRDDRTPRLRYFSATDVTVGTFNGFNETRDYEVNTGKLEARYMLPAGFKLTGALDYDEKTRDVYDLRLTSTRRHTEEQGYRVELSRMLSETVNGSLGFVQSERSGSTLRQETSVDSTAAGNTNFVSTYYAQPYHLADRDREKLRARIDWMPADALSIQVTGDVFVDDYKDGGYGVDKGRGTFWSVDGSYAFSDEWQAYAWASSEYARQDNLQRSTGAGGKGFADWNAALKNLTEAFGLGFRGVLGSAWKIGGDLSYSHNRAEYGLSGAGVAASNVIDDVKYTGTTLKLFAEYALRRDVAVRFDAMHEQWSTNDWIVTGSDGSFVYGDGTTLSQDPTQETTFVGVSMRYNWR